MALSVVLRVQQRRHKRIYLARVYYMIPLPVVKVLVGFFALIFFTP
jgi:hypothetical protein